MRYHVLHATSMPPLESDATLPVELALDAKGVEEDGADGPLPPSILRLVAADKEAEGEVSVTYWVRLLVTCHGRPGEGGKMSPQTKHWSTHPIVLLAGTDTGSV